MYRVLAISLLLAGCASAPVAPPPANDPVTLRVNLFRGSSNIPVYMAIEKGYFARRGITPVIEFTPNSVQQRAGLEPARGAHVRGAEDVHEEVRELGAGWCGVNRRDVWRFWGDDEDNVHGCRE